ncbi:hypothetical protein RND81_10G147300 [Saponaria officinalis]|uniref:Uncharacterized protein n=1 Tax=Saponaria officinalis TaxID=3572 RepID=A0AAW1I3L5_SAPOF
MFSEINCTPNVASLAALSNQYPLVLSYTPGGSEEWVIRRLEIQFKPTIGQVFSPLEDGVEFYKTYSLACGFTHRKYTNKTHWRGGGGGGGGGGCFKNKLVVCNRQGLRENRQRVFPVTDGKGDIDNNSGIDSIKSARRRVKITRIGCQAHIGFALENTLFINSFDNNRFIVTYPDNYSNMLFSLQ